MFEKYVQAAMRQAQYEILEDDGSFFGHIPPLQGVWANEPTLEACREELESALEDWILFGISLHHSFPIIEGLELTVPVEVA